MHIQKFSSNYKNVESDIAKELTLLGSIIAEQNYSNITQYYTVLHSITQNDIDLK